MVIVLEALYGDIDMDLQQLKKVLDLAFPYDYIDIRYRPETNYTYDAIRIVYTTKTPIVNVISIFNDPDKGEELLAICSSGFLPSWFTDVFTATQYCSDSGAYVISLKE